ncbi:response regulator transcription factor, partial [Achromobacter ruhlandii]|uniref:response regulator transcription factor n=1 Tax=Achromobacter ruhlandii TaxID=72557 RepID=UPI00201668F9
VGRLAVEPGGGRAGRGARAGDNAGLTTGGGPAGRRGALGNAAAGRWDVPAAVAELLARTVREDSTRPPHELLSNREFQVLQLLAAGKSVSAIGEQLALSVNTISTYRARIFEKLGVRTLVELVDYARAHQLGAR